MSSFRVWFRITMIVLSIWFVNYVRNKRLEKPPKPPGIVGRPAGAAPLAATPAPPPASLAPRNVGPSATPASPAGPPVVTPPSAPGHYTLTPPLTATLIQNTESLKFWSNAPSGNGTLELLLNVQPRVDHRFPVPEPVTAATAPPDGRDHVVLAGASAELLNLNGMQFIRLKAQNRRQGAVWWDEQLAGYDGDYLVVVSGACLNDPRLFPQLESAMKTVRRE